MESPRAKSESPFVIQGQAGFGPGIGTSRVSAQVVIEQHVARAHREFLGRRQSRSCNVSIESPHIFVFVGMSSDESFQLTVRARPHHRSARVRRHAAQIDKTADEKRWWKREVRIFLQGVVNVRLRPLPRPRSRENGNRVRRLWRRKWRSSARYRCRNRADLPIKARKNCRVADECVMRIRLRVLNLRDQRSSRALDDFWLD